MLTDRSRRSLTLVSTFALATALVVGSNVAHAQSFNGSSTVFSGGATVTTGSGTTNVTVTTPQAVIDWSPTDTAIGGGPIAFQSAGTTATFTNDPAMTASFAVLNRIVPTDPTRAIVFDGNVVSRLQTGAASVPGGTVFFYSPGGIVVGANAVFDVGNLGLTTASPLVDGAGNWYNGNTVQFQQAVSGTAVTIAQGAQINATSNGSYVAAFAPIVTQAGAIAVNGQAALVGAEAGTITFSPNGLFDIQIAVGSDGDGAFSVRHQGSTTGGASTGAGDNRRVYLVTAAKNNLITMAIERGSTLGFDVASAADVVGNAVVLSAGHNVTGGQIAGAAGGAAGADITINDSSTGLTGSGIDFTSAVTARASHSLYLDAFRQTSFASDANLSASERVQATASTLSGDPAGGLSIGGNLNLTSDRAVVPVGATADAGSAFLGALNGAGILVGGNAIITSRSATDVNGDTIITAGRADVLANSGTISIEGGMEVRASSYTNLLPGNFAAIGGDTTVSSQAGGSISVGSVLRLVAEGIAAGGRNGTGGNSALSAQGGSTISVNELNISSDGVGGNDTGSGAGAGAGGTALISADGANTAITIAQNNFTGDINQGQLDLVAAEAFGGATSGGGSGIGGSATGGTVNIVSSAGALIQLPSTVGTLGNIRVIARGSGGPANTGGLAGGQGVGGTINITVDNATLNSAGLLPSAFGQGGRALGTGTINGGDGIGGTRSIFVRNGGVLNTTLVGGSAGAQGGNATATGKGGDASGGFAQFVVDNATVNFAGRAGFFTQNTAGSGGIGGNASGGNVIASIINGSNVTVTGNDPTFYEFSVSASAYSHLSGIGAGTGSVSAGSATIEVINSTLSSARISVDAVAYAGGDKVAQADAGTGGNAVLRLTGATINSGEVRLDASGVGGEVDTSALGQVGNGGAGSGGLALVQNLGGNSRIVGGTLFVGADGKGGSALGPSGNGGSGFGGSARIVSLGGSLVVDGAVDVTAQGIGGDTRQSGVGGSGTAGAGEVFANGGNIAFSNALTIDGSALGGSGTTGGEAMSNTMLFPPRALLRAQNGSVSVVGLTSIIADATGGSSIGGGNGGSGRAGSAVIDAQSNLAGSSQITVGDLFVSAVGNGGAGGDAATGSGIAGGSGGAGVGGTPQAFGDAGNGNLVVSGTSAFDASATGGQGGAGDGAGAGGMGGSAQSGFIQVGTRSGPDTPANTGGGSYGDIFASSDATGGAGGTGGATGVGGAGGFGLSGAATLLVRGSPVTVGNVTMSLTGTGGDGGTGGGGSGAGGDGFAGTGSVTVTQRFQRTERGSLTGGDVLIVSSGSGGAGSTSGLSYFGNGSGLFVQQSDVTLNSLSLFDSGTTRPDFTFTGYTIDAATGTQVLSTIPVTATPFSINVIEGSSVNVATSLTVSTPADVILNIDNSTLNAGTLSLTAGNFLLPATATTSPGTINTSGSLFVDSGGDFATTANINSQGAIDLVLGGSFITGAVASNGYVDITAGGSITTGAISSAGTLDLAAAGTITTGALVAGDTIGVNAVGAVNVASANSGIARVSADPAAQYNIGLRSLASVTAGDLAARGSVGLSSPGTITVGNVSAGSLILALPGTGLTTGSLATAVAGGQVYIADYSMEALGGQVTQTFDPAPILATGPVATAGPVAINGTVSAGVLRANTAQALSIAGAATLAQSVSLQAAGGMNLQNVDAGDSLFLASSGGSIATGTLTAGIVNPSPNPGALYKVAVGAQGSITTGNITGRRDIGLQAGQAVSTGNIVGGDIVLLGGTGIATGGMQAGSVTQPTGRIILANTSMASPGANVFSNFQTLPLFNTQPLVPVSGPITISGAVTSGYLHAATTQGFTAKGIVGGYALQPGSIEVNAGGLVSVDGLWNSQDIAVTSGDIAITANGSVDAGSAGSVLLASTNAAGAFIGDGPTGPGYALSSAEFAKVSAGEIDIVGTDLPQNVADMTIGNLSINASQLYRPDGLVLFATGNLTTQTPSGTLRVDGAITGTGFSPTNYLEFYASRFEMNAATGSIAVADGTGGLGGIVLIDAAQIHVASDQILQKLRVDPLYSGHAAELNAPAAVQRPGGVLKALGLELYPVETLYIQNTGTALVPAGFFTTIDNSDITPPATQVGSGVKLVINGQLLTTTGTVTGQPAYQLVIDNAQSLAGFTGTSQINGCALTTGACTNLAADPVAAISSEVAIVSQDTLQEEPFSDTAENQDEAEADAASSPIAPPAPLIDTRPLNPAIEVVEPVAGAGNPALIGSAVNETTAEEQRQ
ncbi:hypothetical protein ACFO0A_09790 [Novosphingobium tardum]|uniref:Autotransporter domain-containing protein n=1 Tax=Novosphingobium tardum TaxID=1538021 RepID=A0ABV8RQB8_9SPHN